MSLNCYNNCINEILKNEDNKKNKEEAIYRYLKSLKGFICLLKNQTTLDYEYILKEISSIIKLKKICKNELIYQQGEIGKYFYILLNGHLKVLILRPYEYYMSEEEYILFLLQSRLNNQTQILNLCNHYNSLIYPIPYDNFDTFVKDLSNRATKAGLYLDSKNAIKKAKEISEIIFKGNEESSNKNKKTILSPEEYIRKHKVSDNVICNTLLINNYINNSFNHIIEDNSNKIKLIMKDRKKVIIPIYEVFSDLETGASFGELALENSGHIREASIISVQDESYLGYIEKKDYDSLIHESIDKRNKNIFNIVLYFSLYRVLNQSLFEKKYLKFFKEKIFDINSYIFNEGDEIGEMYFITEGEYEISVNKNIIEVYELIIKYKEILKKIINKNHKISENYLNTEEEKKQVNSLILNQKYRTTVSNNLITDKKYIKLNILYEKDIIGFSDVFLYNDEKENYKNDNDNNFNKPLVIYGEQVKKKCLVTCKCLTYNCHTYCLNNNIFNNLYYNEGNNNFSAKKLEIRKICIMIKRLQTHKNYIFSLISKEQNKFSKVIKKLKFFTKNPKMNIKGKIDQNIIADIKTSTEQNERNNYYKLNDIKKQYRRSTTLTNNFNANIFLSNKHNKTNDKFDFSKQYFPSIKKDKKPNLQNKYAFTIKLLKSRKYKSKIKDETIFNIYNKKNNDESQNNLAKLLIRDFLYEKFFYNYTFTDIDINTSNNSISQKNLIKKNLYQYKNEREHSKNNNNTNFKINESTNTQKDFLKTFSIDKKERVINIKRIRNFNMRDNLLCKTSSFNNNNKPYIFRSKFNSLSIDGNILKEKNKNKIVNTVSRLKENKIRLNKQKENKIYDMLAFEKFNDYFDINFRKQYLLNKS